MRTIMMIKKIKERSNSISDSNKMMMYKSSLEEIEWHNVSEIEEETKMKMMIMMEMKVR